MVKWARDSGRGMRGRPEQEQRTSNLLELTLFCIIMYVMCKCWNYFNLLELTLFCKIMYVMWSIINTWLLWERSFCNAIFVGTVIPCMYTLQVEHLGPGVRYTVHLGVILRLYVSSIQPAFLHDENGENQSSV